MHDLPQFPLGSNLSEKYRLIKARLQREREREREARWNRAGKMCEREWEIVKGDVNRGESLRIGESDMGKMGYHDGR